MVGPEHRREQSEDGSNSEEAGPREYFYRGRILRVNYGSGSGIVQTGNGREVRFVLPYVEILDGRKIDDLAEGMEVGFDLGWTSRGLRITKIKIYGFPGQG